MNVRIEHCTVCWGYRDHALVLAEALRARFDASVDVVGGRLGQFDVLVDGRLISARGDRPLARIKLRRLPAVQDVIAAIERQESFPEGRAIRADEAAERFGPAEAQHFYDRFGKWQDLQFYETAALKDLLAHGDFEHASAVFEWGCGTGRLADDLFRNHLPPHARYVGIDISTTMIRIATRRLARWSGRAAIEERDGTLRLPYADGAFDRFVATYVLDLLPETVIHHVLTEARRLLKPTGKLCLAGSTEGITPISRLLSSIWKRLHAFEPRLVGGCRPLSVSSLLDPSAWRIEHARIVCSWGICSEILIGSPAHFPNRCSASDGAPIRHGREAPRG